MGRALPRWTCPAPRGAVLPRRACPEWCGIGRGDVIGHGRGQQGRVLCITVCLGATYPTRISSRFSSLCVPLQPPCLHNPSHCCCSGDAVVRRWVAAKTHYGSEDCNYDALEACMAQLSMPCPACPACPADWATPPQELSKGAEPALFVRQANAKVCYDVRLAPHLGMTFALPPIWA